MRLVITVCPREPGGVVLPLERGERPRRLDAISLAAALEALVEARGLGGRVRVYRACAGGCGLAGPNVSVSVLPEPRPGEPPDHVAVRWRSYVGCLDTVQCLADVVDDNLTSEPAPAPRRRAGRSRRR